jgi:hypothetical protein
MPKAQPHTLAKLTASISRMRSHPYRLGESLEGSAGAPVPALPVRTCGLRVLTGDHGTELTTSLCIFFLPSSSPSPFPFVAPTKVGLVNSKLFVVLFAYLAVVEMTLRSACTTVLLSVMLLICAHAGSLPTFEEIREELEALSQPNPSRRISEMERGARVKELFAARRLRLEDLVASGRDSDLSAAFRESSALSEGVVALASRGDVERSE